MRSAGDPAIRSCREASRHCDPAVAISDRLKNTVTTHVSKDSTQRSTINHMIVDEGVATSPIPPWRTMVSTRCTRSHGLPLAATGGSARGGAASENTRRRNFEASSQSAVAERDANRALVGWSLDRGWASVGWTVSAARRDGCAAVTGCARSGLMPDS